MKTDQQFARRAIHIVAFLGQNNGNVRTLIAHLSELEVNLGKPPQ